MFPVISTNEYEAVKRPRTERVARREQATMTEQDFRALARILRQEELSPQTQWRIVSGVWLAALLAVALTYFVTCMNARADEYNPARNAAGFNATLTLCVLPKLNPSDAEDRRYSHDARFVVGFYALQVGGGWKEINQTEGAQIKEFIKANGEEEFCRRTELSLKKAVWTFRADPQLSVEMIERDR